jgi:hypothetical protein
VATEDLSRLTDNLQALINRFKVIPANNNNRINKSHISVKEDGYFVNS